jgi:hypothetical protein
MVAFIDEVIRRGGTARLARDVKRVGLPSRHLRGNLEAETQAGYRVTSIVWHQVDESWSRSPL